MTTKLKGLAIVDSSFEHAMKACIAGLKENPDLIIYYDIESGYPSLITKEEQQAILNMWESAQPKLNKESSIGKIIVFGTSDKFDKHDHYRSFYKD